MESFFCVILLEASIGFFGNGHDDSALVFVDIEHAEAECKMLLGMCSIIHDISCHTSRNHAIRFSSDVCVSVCVCVGGVCLCGCDKKI